MINKFSLSICAKIGAANRQYASSNTIYGLYLREFQVGHFITTLRSTGCVVTWCNSLLTIAFPHLSPTSSSVQGSHPESWSWGRRNTKYLRDELLPCRSRKRACSSPQKRQGSHFQLLLRGQRCYPHNSGEDAARLRLFLWCWKPQLDDRRYPSQWSKKGNLSS